MSTPSCTKIASFRSSNNPPLGAGFLLKIGVMKNEKYLCRLPFYCADSSSKYRVMGEMKDDPDENLKVPINSQGDIHMLPFCVDCFGDLGWAELLYGVGARQCVQCGSIFQIIEEM